MATMMRGSTDPIVRTAVHSCQRLVERFEIDPAQAASVYLGDLRVIRQGRKVQYLYRNKGGRVWRRESNGQVRFPVTKTVHRYGLRIVTYLTVDMVFDHMVKEIKWSKRDAK